MGLVAPRYEVVTELGFALVAAGVNKEYSRVNFSLLWRLLRLSNSLAVTALSLTSVRLVFADFMLAEGTRAMAAEVGFTLPQRSPHTQIGAETTQLRPFAHVVFSRGKRSLQRRSRRRVASLRVGRILRVSPR